MDSTYRSCTIEGHELAHRQLGRGDPMLLVNPGAAIATHRSTHG